MTETLWPGPAGGLVSPGPGRPPNCRLEALE
jgi:hypothetical protein